MSSNSEDSTSHAQSRTSATLTVRIIKSFEYRTERSLVLHGVDLTKVTVRQLKDIARQAVLEQPGWKAYRNVPLDTLKLYTKAHGAKTTNLIINLDHDDWILDKDDETLESYGIENETELSFFNRQAYGVFKENPTVKRLLYLPDSPSHNQEQYADLLGLLNHYHDHYSVCNNG